NIANINTPGYTRRTLDLAEVPSSSGGGVDVRGVTAARTPLIDARLWHEQPSTSQQGAVADNLSVVQAALGTTGASLDSDLAGFYGAFSALAQDPTSSTARYQVVAKGQALASSFNAMASRIGQVQTDSDFQIRSAVDQVNTLAARLASINTALSGA